MKNTMMYCEMKQKKYLGHAAQIAQFIMNYALLPTDKIPYCDFDAPDASNALRDASAGALIASALIDPSICFWGICNGTHIDSDLVK